jgi:hypothetical protein
MLRLCIKRECVETRVTFAVSKTNADTVNQGITMVRDKTFTLIKVTTDLSVSIKSEELTGGSILKVALAESQLLEIVCSIGSCETPILVLANVRNNKAVHLVDL